MFSKPSKLGIAVFLAICLCFFPHFEVRGETKNIQLRQEIMKDVAQTFESMRSKKGRWKVTKFAFVNDYLFYVYVTQPIKAKQRYLVQFTGIEIVKTLNRGIWKKLHWRQIAQFNFDEATRRWKLIKHPRRPKNYKKALAAIGGKRLDFYRWPSSPLLARETTGVPAAPAPPQVTSTPGKKPIPPPAPEKLITKKLVQATPIITGIVKDALDNKVIKDAEVYFDVKSGLGVALLDKSDSNGKFIEYDDLPEQCTGIRVEHPDYHPRKTPLSLTSGKKQTPLTIKVLIHPKANLHTTIKVSGKDYQVTFTKEDTAKPKKKLLKARIFSLEQNGTTFEDKEFDLAALETDKQKEILLPIHMWIFLNYPISTNATGFDYLRKVSTLNRLYLRAAVKDYKDKKQKTEIKENIALTLKTLKNLDDLRQVAMGTYVAEETAKVLLGNLFIDPILEGMGGWAADVLLGVDIEKYPEQRQHAVESFYYADHYFLGKNEALHRKALNCMPNPSSYWVDGREVIYGYRTLQIMPGEWPEHLQGPVPLGKGLDRCEEFLGIKDSNTARAIKVNVSRALENMVEGLKFMEKVPRTFEGKEGFWMYEPKANYVDLKETGNGLFDPNDNSITLTVPRDTLAIKVHSDLDPILDEWAAKKYNKDVAEPKFGERRFSDMASFQYLNSDCYTEGDSVTDNFKKDKDYASLVFDVPKARSCTMKIELGEDTTREIKKYYKPFVYINYLLEKTVALKKAEKPLKDFKILIDNLGETNEIILVEN